MNKFVGTLLCAMSVLASTHAAADEPWPSKPIRWIVPLAAGGPADGIARMVADSLSKKLGQQIIIDNKAGAATNIGNAEAVRAAPDGYTILYVMPSIVLNPGLFRVAVDPIKDLEPVAQMTSQAYVMMARQGYAKSMPEIIDKARKDGVACANGGGLPYFGCEWLRSLTKTDVLNAQFKGNGPAITALLGGHVDIMIDLFNTALPHIEAGSVEPIALTGERRGEPLPKLPTVSETIPGFTLVGWHGVMAPKGTPAAIVQRLNKAIGEAMEDPAVRKYFADSHIDIARKTPAEFGQVIAADLAKYAGIIRDAKIQKQ